MNYHLRYFDANTIWYLQFHFVCAKLSLSFGTFECPPFVSRCAVARPLFYSSKRSFYCHPHRLSFLEPHAKRGGFRYTKIHPAAQQSGISVKYFCFFTVYLTRGTSFEAVNVSMFLISILILLPNRAHAVERIEQITHVTYYLRLAECTYRTAVV